MNQVTTQNTPQEWLSDENKRIIRKQFFPPNATDSDMQYCIAVAKSFNLNPILKQIFFVERKAKINGEWHSKIEPLAGRDSFLTLAHRSGKFAGIKSDCFLKDKPVFINGGWQNKKELVAIAQVYKKGHETPFEAEVRYDEYVQKTSDGRTNKFWAEKPETMLKKVAESQALRKAFDISGLYSVDEVGENEDKDDKLPQKLQTPKTQNLNELLSCSEKPNSSVSAKNSQTDEAEYIEAAPVEVEIDVNEDVLPLDALQSELMNRGASEDEAEKLLERVSLNEARAYLADPNSVDALMENLRS
ncbi:phage recombination protein Bet [Campylobacter showae]|uniref:phage recombination protein Bet n=1 Tax=Campylobacter showae TaxID=204 RepID=UPI0028D1736A|nr:phage recombination protein Bet [Campylobacter showae]